MGRSGRKSPQIAGSLPSTCRALRRAAAGERGAVLVEAAVVLPLPVLTLVGILEVGLLYSSHSTNTAASRSGARVAATEYSEAGRAADAQALASERIATEVAATLTALRSAEPIGMAIDRADTSSATGAPVGGFPARG
jgi:Flp pilus assembly protein TadG